MLFRAIVEEVVDKFHIRIRIPTKDRLHNSVGSTSTEMLSIATVCSLPNCSLNAKPGDIVFIAFEENITKKPVVIGYLCRNFEYDTKCDIDIQELNVISKCALPMSTSIGCVTGEELGSLSGVTDNIQQQLNNIRERLEQLENKG